MEVRTDKKDKVCKLQQLLKDTRKGVYFILNTIWRWNMAELFIGLGCTVLGAGLGLVGFVRTAKKDLKDDTKASTKLETKIDYISKGVDDIRLDIKSQDRKINDLIIRVVRVEESAKSAHKRLDGLEGGV